MRARGVIAAVLVSALTLGLLFLTTTRSRLVGRALPASIGELTAEDVVPHLRFLASDRLEGRAPATRGGDRAAQYLATQLSLLGYAPAGDSGTYFQDVPLIESITDPQPTLRVGDDLPLESPADIVAFSEMAVSRVDVAAEVVFVGHGIVAPEYGWDDYADATVRGKVVLVLVDEPRATAEEPTLFGGDALTYYGRWTYKLEEAARQGVAGVLLVHSDESAGYPWQVVRSSWGGTRYSVSRPPGESVVALEGWVSEDAARRIVRTAGLDLDDLRRAANKRATRAVPLGVQLSGTLVQRVRQRRSPNVVGVLQGTDPSSGVLLTAHYDSLGVRLLSDGESDGDDRIFNGALDNASGVAGMLAIARALAGSRVAPKRSIYVVFTTAEESGQLGSSYFIGHAAMQPAAWAACVNLDQLNVFGRARDLVLIGAERSSIRDVARSVAAGLGRVIALDPDPGQGHFFRSDHFPAAKAGVPAVSVGLPVQFVGPGRDAARARRDAFNGTDYHQTSDEIRDDWNYDGAVDDLRLLATIIWRLANDVEPPAYHAADPFALPRR